ncbi:mitotic spindle assembly checkpoint protein [Chloropicon primus]|uniref:Mitotic spindle assembly checkpoint protein n=1 Tax=Chloropicon primus TaxID=1764295 RepID=A0A5B8MW46_9CHLO|nr:mitotic spindle assembly checkpoint protein [Chloropicon primus]UPR03865.1 mitotic spindle assembly checkpoint protein [Chloropicon primus]|mmetsp:Transcript_648/g.1923  ORF Transcript_648/g.1923 Transcript_648/m.1923 type:complete len:203 (+) Transcript_648:317-925(+)|eukprot:QDZ24657.1 mitotic spindle assembly checkpoint protein [Chloropicon primus]
MREGGGTGKAGGGEASTSDIVCEFLEAAVHTALRVKGVYPAEVFERRRLYNVAVSRSRHPGLNTYIKETVFSLKPWIVQKKLEKLTLVFYEAGSDKVIERLVFSVKILREIEAGSLETFEDLEHMLRAFILKIQVTDPLKEGSRFELLAYSRSRQDDNTVWVMEDASSGRVGAGEPKIVPIKSLSSDFLRIQLYSEIPPETT